MRLEQSDAALFYQLWFPLLLDAVLIPFRDSIISDGLVVPYRIYFGKGAIEDFKEVYMNAKRNRAIHFSI